MHILLLLSIEWKAHAPTSVVCIDVQDKGCKHHKAKNIEISIFFVCSYSSDVHLQYIHSTSKRFIAPLNYYYKYLFSVFLSSTI